MKRFKKILLLFRDERVDQAALQRAVALMRANRARLTVVGVVPELPRDVRMLVSSVHPLDLQKLEIRDRTQQLEAILAAVRDDGIRVAAKVLCGTPFLEVIREVLRSKHDLVVLTAEGRGGLKERLFGSTSMHLMRKCPCAVWVMRPTRRIRYSKILAAVDTDPSDNQKEALNVKIMDLASSLARMENSRLHIVHAWRLEGESTLRSGFARVPAAKLSETLREVRGQHKQHLERLLKGYPLQKIKHQVHLLKGHADKLIPALAAAEKVNLVVMGTVCRTGIPGFMIGNTAERILQQVDCSVLTAKPDGFVTPVTLAT